MLRIVNLPSRKGRFTYHFDTATFDVEKRDRRERPMWWTVVDGRQGVNLVWRVGYWVYDALLTAGAVCGARIEVSLTNRPVGSGITDCIVWSWERVSSAGED